MMDWCASHPKYEAKRKPNSLCGRCWALYFIKNPEDRNPVEERRGQEEVTCG